MSHQKGVSGKTPPPNVNANAANPPVHTDPAAAAPPLHANLRYTIGSQPSIEEAVREGKMVIGRLKIYSRYTSGLAFVTNPAFPCDVVVSGANNKKCALHGDIVAVELFPEERWQSNEKNEHNNDKLDADDSADDDVENDDTVCRSQTGANVTGVRWVRDSTVRGALHPEVRLTKAFHPPESYEWGGKKPFGCVVTTLESSCALTVVARLARGAIAQGEPIRANRYYRFECYDPLMPHICIFGRDIATPFRDALDRSLFLIRIVTQPGSGILFVEPGKPRGVISRLLGGTESVAANSHALCSAFDVKLADFSEDAYACVPDELKIPDKEELRRMGRRDLREEEFICSIDPSTARDLDDALSITRTPGGYRVGVHIADVSYFVPVGSALDEEARERSTSVYLVEQVISMLPRKLSEDYCSLNPGSDKFAFSCLFHLDYHGKVQSEWFGQSLIRNRCRLSYEEAQLIIDGDKKVLDTLDFGSDVAGGVEELKTRVVESITTLYELASKLRAKSLERGRLTIGNMRIRFDFEDIAKPTFPLGFGISRQIEANWVIEEFMLLANGRTAQKVLEYLPDQALLRCHEPPDRKKLITLRKVLEESDLHLHGSSSKALQTFLDNSKNYAHYDDLCVMLKYSLQSAKYFANACVGESAYRGHYALAMEWYTHFTSPIRRYCDIMVHRQLLCALEVESIVKAHPDMAPDSIDADDLNTRDFFYPVSEVESITEIANTKKLNARRASDGSLRFFFCQYLDTLKRLWHADPNAQGPFTPRVEAVVVRVIERNRTFVLFVAEVALEVEVGLRDSEQRFTFGDKKEEEEETDGNNDTHDAAHSEAVRKGEKQRDHNIPNRPEGGGAAVPTTHAGGNTKETNNKKKKNEDEKNKRLLIHWGKHPTTGEEVTEEVRQLVIVTGVLMTRRVCGYQDLGIIIDAPWERNSPCTGVATTIPKYQG